MNSRRHFLKTLASGLVVLAEPEKFFSFGSTIRPHGVRRRTGNITTAPNPITQVQLLHWREQNLKAMYDHYQAINRIIRARELEPLCGAEFRIPFHVHYPREIGV